MVLVTSPSSQQWGMTTWNRPGVAPHARRYHGSSWGVLDSVVGSSSRGSAVGTSCPATLGPLHCTRETDHVPDAGCVYVSTSSAPDGKADADRLLEDLYA